MKNEIGVIGLAVMGKNLALNIADHGYNVSVYNRTEAVTKQMQENEDFENINYTYTLEEFVNSLAKPRKILIMIKSGSPVDATIKQLLPLLDKGDILIDGGNSYFKDTQKRYDDLQELGLEYIGLGVSGGESGARFGPAMMPGGSKDAYSKVESLLQDIAAKHKGDPCCKYTSTGGAGHYVKMVHNGIEYGDMELIAEAYFMLKQLFGLKNSEISEIFSKWNEDRLKSYLIEISAKILLEKDSESDNDLLDMILDISAQKGTGKWTNLEAIELGVYIPILSAGLNARYMSMLKDERKIASEYIHHSKYAEKSEVPIANFIEVLEASLYISKIMSYAQGFRLLKEAEKTYGWKFDFAEISTIFREGCIIRADLLSDIQNAYKVDEDLDNLMFDKFFSRELNSNIGKLRILISELALLGVSAPAFYGAMSYIDSYVTYSSSANMIQAQRDFFGAHTFRRIDKEGSFHHEWTE